MNKKMKRLLILLGILVVVCIAAVAASMYQEKQEQIATTEDVILSVATEDVTALSWDFEDSDTDAESGSFTFTLTDGTWIYADDEAFPTDTDAIESLLSVFTEFGASFIIEEVEDYSQYGLSDPCATITITTADAEYVVELGDFSTMDSQRYVSIGDGNAYLVSVDPMDYYAVTISDLIDNDETPSFDAVSSIEADGEESLTISYEEESTAAYTEDDVYFTEVSGETTPLDPDSVDTYLNKIQGLDLTEYVTYSASEDDLSGYGFDDPELTVTIEYTDTVSDEDGNEVEESGTFVLTVARDADQIAAAEEAEAAEEEESDSDSTDEDDDEEDYAAYVRIGESAIIYGIYSSDYESLMACTYADLAYLDLVPMDVTEITMAQITIGGEETYEFTVETDEDENQIWYYEGEEIDSSDLTSALSALEVSEYSDESASGTEEISVVLTLSNENYESLSFTLYRYDGENCLAVTDSGSNALVSRSDTMDLVEAVNAIILN